MSCTGTPGATAPPCDTTLVSDSPLFAGNCSPSAVFAAVAGSLAWTAGATIPMRLVLALAGGVFSAVPRLTRVIVGRLGMLAFAGAGELFGAGALMVDLLEGKTVRRLVGRLWVD